MAKKIEELQAKDFAKWVRKQVRLFGRNAEICSQRYSAVEIWLQELGIQAGFICGGEVEYASQVLYTDWAATSYYMMDENGQMEIEAGRWLDICGMEEQSGFLIAR